MLLSQILSQPFTLSSSSDSKSLLTKTLLTGNLELAVEMCVKAGRTADALILASQGAPDLMERTMKT